MMRDFLYVDKINDWILEGKKKWNEPVDRMTEGRIVEIPRDKSSAERKSTGRS